MIIVDFSYSFIFLEQNIYWKAYINLDTCERVLKVYIKLRIDASILNIQAYSYAFFEYQALFSNVRPIIALFSQIILDISSAHISIAYTL